MPSRYRRFPVHGASSETQQGLSLVELMVAMVIGMILIGAVLQVFTSSSQTYRLTQANARVQESGRIAIDLLSRAFRNAGYYGCAQDVNVTNNLDVAAWNPDFHDIGGPGLGMPNNTAAYNAGTHSIRLTGARTVATDLRTTLPNASAAAIALTTPGSLAEEDHVIISDCTNADVFEISNINGLGQLVANNGTGNPGNNMTANAATNANCTGANCFSANYQANALILRAYSELYYIANNLQGNPALFLDEGNGPIELVDNIRDMRLRFTDNDGVVTDWSDPLPAGFNFGNVAAVDISLLVHSDRQNVLAEDQNLCFPVWANCVNPADFTSDANNRLLRVYSTTIALRN